LLVAQLIGSSLSDSLMVLSFSLPAPAHIHLIKHTSVQSVLGYTFIDHI